MVNNIGYSLLVTETHMVGRKGLAFNHNLVPCWGGSIERNLEKTLLLLLRKLRLTINA